MIDFEFSFEVEGRVVDAVGTAVIDYQCECCDQDHIREVNWNSIIDAGTGLEVQRNDHLMTELEQEADHVVYQMLEDERGTAGMDDDRGVA